MTDDRRRVSFVVVSERHSADDLRRLIGVGPDVKSRALPHVPFEATWELRAAGSGEVDLSSLIENVLARIAPLRDVLIGLRTGTDDIYCKLEILQYVGDDPIGPGFAIEPEHIALLAELGAVLDVDQYFDG